MIIDKTDNGETKTFFFILLPCTWWTK